MLAAARNAGRDVNRLSGKQRITLTSIADEAGVPVATVKRILESRKGGGFAAVTMDRVAGAATQSVENLSYLAERRALIKATVESATVAPVAKRDLPHEDAA